MSSASPTSEAPRTIGLDDEEGVRRVLVDTLFGLWSTVNSLSRLRPSRKERYRVTVFGSARAEPETWVYDEVRRMCAGLSAIGCDLLTDGPAPLRRDETHRAGPPGWVFHPMCDPLGCP